MKQLEARFIAACAKVWPNGPTGDAVELAEVIRDTLSTLRFLAEPPSAPPLTKESQMIVAELRTQGNTDAAYLIEYLAAKVMVAQDMLNRAKEREATLEQERAALLAEPSDGEVQRVVAMVRSIETKYGGKFTGVVELIERLARSDKQQHDLIGTLTSALEQAEQQLAAAQADARRYRWLRGEDHIVHQFWLKAARDKQLTLDMMDAAIDAAQSQEPIANRQCLSARCGKTWRHVDGPEEFCPHCNWPHSRRIGAQSQEPSGPI